MAEPRARQRGKGQVFNTGDLTDLLYAFGDHHRTRASPAPLASTIQCFDEILTDFVIEICHSAALSASYSRRQKIKVDDFKWVARKNEDMLGRAMEHLWRERVMKDDRRMPGFDEKGEGVEQLEGLAEAGGVKGRDMREGKRRRKKRKVRLDRAEDASKAGSKAGS